MLAITHPVPNAVELSIRPDPVAGDGQILVAVRAAGLNRADLHQRAGNYPAPPGWPADIPGLEYAGEVKSIGADVKRWKVGDRVMGLVGGGAHAELVVVDQREVLSIPEGLRFTDAAAIPEAFLTAWDAIAFRGRATDGDRVLVHAIGSGVGTAAVQLGRELDLSIIGTSRSQDKLDRCRALGMVHGVLTNDDQWPARVGEPVQVIIDTLGKDAFQQNLGLLAQRGRLVVLGTLTGGQASGLDLSLVLRQRLQIVGTAMRIRSLSERIELVELFSRLVLPLFDDGRLKPIVDRIIPMRQIETAHRVLQSNATFGKVVLAW